MLQHLYALQKFEIKSFVKLTTENGVELQYICSELLADPSNESADDSEVRYAYNQHSDLVPNVYEGTATINLPIN